MKKTILLLLMLALSLTAGFFQTEEQLAQELKEERKHFCNFFTHKAKEYKKNMRNDELAYLTLESYNKRATIYCSEILIKEAPLEKKIEEVVTLKKNIYLEDERLCKIFKDKIIKYKKNMRDDALAKVTLQSYKQRAYIFCSEESLENKEKKVREEDEKLCHLFSQGPKVCILFEKKVAKQSTTELSKTTFDSFKRQANIFCSNAELEEKDKKVHEEHQKLCTLYSKKMDFYKKSMSKDENYKEHLKLYEKRFNYFCGTKK